LPEILYRLKDQNIILIIAGDGPEKENIQLQISNYQLQDKVRLLGWIPQNKVLDYFAISDIFLMPSEEEGFPHVLLESMVAGVPFVATDVGGVREMIPNAALPYIVESGDVAVASEKTKALLHLRGTPLRSLQQELMQWVRRYDIKKVAEKFSEIILAR
jgi:glycosyltransferase involved in cell wall biosynthesis